MNAALPRSAPANSSSRPALRQAPAADVLVCSRYVDHVLYFLLERLSATVRLHVLCSRQNQWTDRLAGISQRLLIRQPDSRFDRRYKAAISRMYADTPWSLVHCVHGNAELANIIQWSNRRLPVIGYQAYVGHLKFRENPSVYWNVRNPGLAAVVGVSRAVRDYLESFRFFRPPNVHVIHHGVDQRWIEQQTRPRYELRARLDIGPDALIVLTMANLRPNKRFELFVEAARRLAGRSVHFVHLGADHGWKQKALQLDNLHFLGHVPHPWPILAEGDVFASTAHNEALGRSNLEAMACGKPLIGSDTGGLPDLIEDGVNGRLFRSGDADSFVDRVLFYEQDRRALERHSANAEELSRTRFSADTAAQQYLDLYSRVSRSATPPA